MLSTATAAVDGDFARRVAVLVCLFTGGVGVAITTVEVSGSSRHSMVPLLLTSVWAASRYGWQSALVVAFASGVAYAGFLCKNPWTWNEGLLLVATSVAIFALRRQPEPAIIPAPPKNYASQVDCGMLRGRAMVRDIRTQQMPALLGWEVERMLARGRLSAEDIALLNEIARAAAHLPDMPLFGNLNPDDLQTREPVIIQSDNDVRSAAAVGHQCRGPNELAQ